MNTQIEYIMAVHAERLARLHVEARRERPVRPARTETRRLRRAIGRSLVRAGQMIAAEASAPERSIDHLTPAGSR
jgi:hypothetical protein